MVKNKNNKTYITISINHPYPASFTYRNKKGENLLNHQFVDEASEISLDPWGVAIIKEK